MMTLSRIRKPLQALSLAVTFFAANPSASAETEALVPSGRLEITPDYHPPADLSRIKVAFFDADSTLRVSKSGSVSANAVDDVRLLPYIEGALKRLAEKGYLIYIVSNQGGIAQGYVTEAVASGALRTTIRLIREGGGVVHGYDFAEDDRFRKPKPAMRDRLLENLRKKFGPKAEIDASESFMIGDSAYKKGVDLDRAGAPGKHFSNADRLFADAIGVRFEEPSSFFGWEEFGLDFIEKEAQVDEFIAKCRANPLCLAKLSPESCAGVLDGRLRR